MGMAISVPRLTVADLEQFPNDGNRYELLDGLLLVTPQARQAHQRIAGRLHAALTSSVGRCRRPTSS
jgi:Uma2 family endonuclease